VKTAIYPGSFDPVTYGHIDIIERAAKLFDKLIVAVSVNPVKPTDFSTEERMDFLHRSINSLENVEIDSNPGLFVDYFKRRNADVIIRGLRAISDFEYEFQMALINRDMCNTAETVFLTANSESMFMSSSAVKQVAMFGGNISAFVPSCIAEDIAKKLKK
jgi:pantetheine-phosphate adenylyltransferase